MIPMSALASIVVVALTPPAGPPVLVASSAMTPPPPATQAAERTAEDAATDSIETVTAPPPPPADTAPPDPAVQPPVATLDPAVDVFLDRLEANGESLRTLTADVTYWKYDDLLGRSVIRMGTLIASIDPAADDKRFAILFTHVVRGTRRQETSMNYIFDGHFLAEVDYGQKVFLVHELVEPGKRIDPLRLGEGPIPLPIAQRKSDILARFTPTLQALPDEGPLARLSERSLVGLRLTPHVGTPEAKTWQYVDVFYDAESMVPIGIEVQETNLDRRTIILANEQRNTVLSDEETLRLSIDPPDQEDGWMIERRAWNDR